MPRIQRTRGFSGFWTVDWQHRRLSGQYREVNRGLESLWGGQIRQQTLLGVGLGLVVSCSPGGSTPETTGGSSVGEEGSVTGGDLGDETSSTGDTDLPTEADATDEAEATDGGSELTSSGDTSTLDCPDNEAYWMCEDAPQPPGEPVCLRRMRVDDDEGPEIHRALISITNNAGRPNVANFSGIARAYEYDAGTKHNVCGIEFDRLERGGDQCVFTWQAYERYPGVGNTLPLKSGQLEFESGLRYELRPQGDVLLTDDQANGDAPDMSGQNVSISLASDEFPSIQLDDVVRMPGPMIVEAPMNTDLLEELEVVRWQPVEGVSQLSLLFRFDERAEEGYGISYLDIRCTVENDGTFEVPRDWLDRFVQAEEATSLTLVARVTSLDELDSGEPILSRALSQETVVLWPPYQR